MTTLLKSHKLELPGILVVDDDSEIWAAVKDAIGEDNAEFCCIDSPDELDSVDPECPIEVCILDVRFKEVTQIYTLLPSVRERWPEAAILVLTSFPKDLDETETEVIPFGKLTLQTNPAAFRAEIVKALKRTGAIDPAILRDFEARLERMSIDSVDQEVDLFVMCGFVAEIHEPYVDVVVQENPQEEGTSSIFFRLSHLFRQRDPVQDDYKRLRLSYANFKAAGIGQDMAFRYRIFRRGNETVLKVEHVESTSSEAEPLEMSSELQTLLEAEEKLLKESTRGRSHGK
jgi:hypothetical protein